MHLHTKFFMALTTTEQISQLIKNKKQILVTFRKDATGDAIASALALLSFLEKRDKQVDVICSDFELPKQFSFLKNSEKIKPSAGYLQKFIVSLDVKETGVEELSYDLKDEKLKIFVTPKQGFLTRQNIKTAQSDFKYDLIFVLDTQELEGLGRLYDNNTELFYKTPIVNIDYHPANEHFGQINLSDLTVVSTAEILFDLMKKLGEEYVDENIATALLTGMISKTKSFKTDNVKPHTLAMAGKLMSLGADREKIVTNLFRTRSIAALKLWGHALTHIQSDKELGLVWSTITRDDFVRCGANELDLKDIIDELISNSPEAEITLLIHEHNDGADDHTIHGLIRVGKEHNAKQMLQPFNPEGGKSDVSFRIKGKTLKEVEEEVVNHIKKELKK